MTPEEILARLLYRDGLMLVIDKPAGIAVHRGPKGGAALDDYFAPLRFGLPRDPALAHRLDRDTTGVLLLTNDGALAERLMHPRHGVAKTYRARVSGEPEEAALDRLRAGIELEDGPTAPAEVESRGTGVVDITIHEGRNRQVRRMFAAIGHPVIHLDRRAYAGITTGRLARGEWRALTPDEVEALHRA